MNPEILAWAKATFTFTIDPMNVRRPFKLLFIEADSHCVLDLYISHARNRKQLEYDMNQFMLELEKVL